mgnify:CR=1 FL=1
MFKPLKSILFATTLLENCKPAFDFAASLAIKYQATLVLLHVIEKSVPDYVEGRIKGLFGDEYWKQIEEKQEKDAKQVLIGKQSASSMIREALENFCEVAGISNEDCGYNTREIVVSHGDAIDEIIAQSEKFNCDLIVLGARKGFLSTNSIGPTIKGVMRASKISVMVVPPAKA